MKKMAALLMALILMLGLCQSALACTGVIVGKGVSADGSFLVGRTEDIGSAYNKTFTVVPAAVSSDEVVFTDEYNGFTMPLPKESFRYTQTRDVPEHDDGIYAEACMNEFGVSITATISTGLNDAAKEADPLVENGLREASLPTVVIPYVKTAKEAVALLGSIVETYGSDAGNTIFIADYDEAWIVEIVSGHQWAAQKVPDDQYAVVPNCMMLGYIDLEDTENYMGSATVFSMPEEKGFLKTHNDKPHLALTYGSEDMGAGNRLRAWGGRHFFSPSQNIALDTPVFEVFHTPDAPITLEQAMDVMRYRYEDTEHSVNVVPENRAIGTERTVEAHIYQYRPGKPMVQWLAMGNPEHSVFLPSYVSLTETPAAYQVEGEAYTLDSAYWSFRMLSALAELDRENYGASVRAYWKGYEQKLISGMEEHDAKFTALSGEEASTYANAMFADIAGDAIAKANLMQNELMFFIAKRGPAATVREPFAPSCAAE